MKSDDKKKGYVIQGIGIAVGTIGIVTGLVSYIFLDKTSTLKAEADENKEKIELVTAQVNEQDKAVAVMQVQITTIEGYTKAIAESLNVKIKK